MRLVTYQNHLSNPIPISHSIDKQQQQQKQQQQDHLGIMNPLLSSMSKQASFDQNQLSSFSLTSNNGNGIDSVMRLNINTSDQQLPYYFASFPIALSASASLPANSSSISSSSTFSNQIICAHIEPPSYNHHQQHDVNANTNNSLSKESPSIEHTYSMLDAKEPRKRIREMPVLDLDIDDLEVSQSISNNKNHTNGRKIERKRHQSKNNKKREPEFDQSPCYSVNLLDQQGEKSVNGKMRTSTKSSLFCGVSRCLKDGRWQARIRYGNEVKYLGRFLTEEMAARTYDAALIILYGNKNNKLKHLNFDESLLMLDEEYMKRESKNNSDYFDAFRAALTACSKFKDLQSPSQSSITSHDETSSKDIDRITSNHLDVILQMNKQKSKSNSSNAKLVVDEPNCNMNKTNPSEPNDDVINGNNGNNKQSNSQDSGPPVFKMLEVASSNDIMAAFDLLLLRGMQEGAGMKC